LAFFGVWFVVDPFESAFTSHLPPLLAASQSLSPPIVTTIYGLFLAFTTAIIIVSDFKLKVLEYSTLSLRGDVRIYGNIYILCIFHNYVGIKYSLFMG
jgi:hypothetical protein